MLDQSVRFRFEVTANDASLQGLAERLHSELVAAGHGRGRERRNIQNLYSVLANLYAAWDRAPGLYVAYPRDSHAYAQNRYNPLGLTYRLPSLIDGMHDLGYLEIHSGFFDRESGRSRQSRMRANHPLIRAFQDVRSNPVQAVERELIELRVKHPHTGKSVPIDYDDTVHTNSMRARVASINAVLANADIRLGEPDPRNPTRPTNLEREYEVALSHHQLRRIFTQGSWTKCGRFYGGWWQQLPENVRTQITINGQRTVELDFKAMQPTLAYLLAGIDYWQEIGTDPYDICEKSVDFRPIVKCAFLIALNAASRSSSAKALIETIRNNYPEIRNQKSFGLFAYSVMKSLEKAHAPLIDFLYTGIGQYLQYVDSKIAGKVLKHLTELDIPCLPVHDSFIVPENYEDYLKSSMEESLKSVCQDEFFMKDPKCLVVPQYK